MNDYILKFREKISRKASHDLILAMAKLSFRGGNVKFSTDASVKRYLKKHGVDFKQLVEKCRIFKENIPYFENLVGSTWTVSEKASLAAVDKEGHKKSEVQGPGTLTVSTYWSLFEEALHARDRSVESNSYSAFQNAIVSGIASIEAYINYRVEIWNKIKPSEQLIDSPTNKIPFDDKIDIWLPKMSEGKKLDKSIRNWSDFKELRKIRDHISIHPKTSSYGISLSELAEKINCFRTGISGILIQLHKIFEESIPANIIRTYFSPDVEVWEKAEKNI